MIEDRKLLLEGLNVGLCGAIPEKEHWDNKALDYEILNFVRTFSGLVMKYGGNIVHGCHPSFTPILLKQSENFMTDRCSKPLILTMSYLWAKNYKLREIDYHSKYSEFIITDQIGDGNYKDIETRNKSLTEMRTQLVNKMDIIVSIGGMIHQGTDIIQGVKEENDIAEENNIPRLILPLFEGCASTIESGTSWIDDVFNDKIDIHYPERLKEQAKNLRENIQNIRKLKKPEFLEGNIDEIGEYSGLIFNYLIEFNKIKKML